MRQCRNDIIDVINKMLCCCIIYFTHIPFRHFLNSTQSSFTYNDIQCPHCAKKAFTSAFVALPPDSDNRSSSANSMTRANSSRKPQASTMMKRQDVSSLTVISPAHALTARTKMHTATSAKNAALPFRLPNLSTPNRC